MTTLSFPKRVLEGKFSPETEQMAKMIKPIQEAQTLEQQLFSEDNIVAKREEMKALMPMILAGSKEQIESAQAVCDMEYFTVKNEEDGHELKSCLIRPKTLKDDPKAPVYIYAHGGGGVVGDAKDGDNLLTFVARNLNCVVINADFRNGPEVKAPTGMMDYRAIVKYVMQNAATHNLDANKICLAGISGGGWISVGACVQMIKKDEMDLEKIKAIFVQTGMLTNETAAFHDKRDQLHDYEAGAGNTDLVMTSTYKLHATDWENQQNDDALFPGKTSDEILAKFPPIAVFTSEFDFLRRDNLAFAERARKVGKLIDIEDMPGVGHGFQMFNLATKENQWFMKDEKAAFDVVVCGKPQPDTFEFTYFPNHLRGIIPRFLIAHLDHNDTIKDVPIPIKEFFTDAKKYAGRFGQAPVLKNTKTDEFMGQQNSIIRFLARTFKGKDGTDYYPGVKDPMLSLQIDQWVDQQDSWFLAMRNHMVPFLDAYKNAKDDHFITYICEFLPGRLEKIEAHLKSNRTKFLCANHVTLADFAIGTHLLRHVHNPKYDQEHIVLSVLEKYPLAHAWVDNYKNYVKTYWTTEGNNWEVNY